MTARYLVRFDDICPGMNWRVWEKVEETLSNARVKPILAIVPSNKDAALNVSEPKADFWNRVRAWTAKGWSIAIHGYQHLYETRNAGIVGLNAFSEFAGLPYQVQKAKLTRALEIFSREGISPKVWSAPGHSFDETTVRVLKESAIGIVSDGFYFRPQVKLGMVWVPQQLWRFRSMPTGTWTVCLHHNRWSERELERLRTDLQRFRPSIVSLDEVATDAGIATNTIFDEVFAYAWRSALRIRSIATRAAED